MPLYEWFEKKYKKNLKCEGNMKNKYILKNQTIDIIVIVNKKEPWISPYQKIWMVNGIQVAFENLSENKNSSSEITKQERRDFKRAVKAAVSIGNIEEEWIQIGRLLKNIISALKKRIE